jgi:hypothetical protein
MKVVCAWCQKLLVDDASDGAKISHGICEDCLRKMQGETAVSLTDFVNELEIPVLVTDRDWVVIEANHAAGKILGQPATRMKQARGGMAIECYYAGLPDGCGKTPQCRGCALRKNIADTYADGQPRYGLYAQQQLMAGDAPRMVQFRFSTQKMGEMVMFAIEEIKDLGSVP